MTISFFTFVSDEINNDGFEINLPLIHHVDMYLIEIKLKCSNKKDP